MNNVQYYVNSTTTSSTTLPDKHSGCIARYNVAENPGLRIGDAVAGTQLPISSDYRLVENLPPKGDSILGQVTISLNHSILIPFTAGANVQFKVDFLSQHLPNSVDMSVYFGTENAGAN